MRTYEEDKRDLIYLINKYCIDDLKEELLDIVKNKFAPKYVFSKFSSNSKMTKEDADLYSIIIHEYIYFRAGILEKFKIL